MDILIAPSPLPTIRALHRELSPLVEDGLSLIVDQRIGEEDAPFIPSLSSTLFALTSFLRCRLFAQSCNLVRQFKLLLRLCVSLSYRRTDHALTSLHKQEANFIGQNRLANEETDLRNKEQKISILFISKHYGIWPGKNNSLNS